MAGYIRDILHSARSLVRARTFTAVCVTSLGLGMGVVIAILLFTRAVVGTPPHVTAAGLVELVVRPSGALRAQAGAELIDTWSYADYLDMRGAASGMAITGWSDADGIFRPAAESAAVPLPAMYVSSNYFSTIGVTLLRGPGFRPFDDTARAEPEAVISYRMWQIRFAGDPNIIGRRITVNQSEYVVTGVTAEGFRGHFSGLNETHYQLWLPLPRHPRLATIANARLDRTDRRNPTVNANGPIYAGEFSYNSLVMVDPKKHTNEMVRIPTRPDAGQLRPFLGATMEVPSPYWGEEAIWNETIQPNDVNLDQDGRVWMVSAIRMPEQQPAYCTDGNRSRYAKAAPLQAGNRQLSYYDPRTKQFTQIDTCFRTHHLQFAEDADNTLYASGNGTTIGWVNTKLLLQTGNAEQAQGWCTAHYDSNGDGRIDPAADRKLDGTSYGIVVSPADGSVWFASPGTPGRIFRMTRGANPPETCLFEVYEPPFQNARAAGVTAFFPRGVDIDRNGVVWTALAGSNHIASFDRRTCGAVRSAEAPGGQHCPEGWTLYPVAGPRFKGVTDEIGTDMFYYHWVDQHDTLGLGRNIPIATGTNSDSLIALIPGTRQQITLRVPYPMGGFFARSMDGRIDDPRAGWKGRGLWAPNASRPTWHQETGKGATSFVAQFQMRPNPLAK